jgi:hypothetical protein
MLIAHGHTLICPSAVMRRRLQVPQKWSDILLMNPKDPICPGMRYDRAVSFKESDAFVASGYFATICCSRSAEGTILAESHLFPFGT